MKIILFSHPSFIGSQSMPRYANMLYKAMTSRGHSVEIWTAKSVFNQLINNKWGGYIDQFLLFPLLVKRRMKKQSTDTLYVFADQALGPWIPLVAQRKHIVHCHDFLAQYSAINQLADNKVGLTGKLYQAYIRSGYHRANQFICISEKTRQDLGYFMQQRRYKAQVIYNGINPLFQPASGSRKMIIDQLAEKYELSLSDGFILHVGGNQFYKNRVGVVEIYNQVCASTRLALVLIGQQPDNKLQDVIHQSPHKSGIYTLTRVDDADLLMFYQAAHFFLFPSLEEGFGWPIAEAQACGCPVVTTNNAPMTEVGGEAAVYIPRRKSNDADWAKESAIIIREMLNESETVINNRREQGLENVKRFSENRFFDQLESCYLEVFNS
jgi:glycosyltransferase involved in cell wall biosynthesis